MLFRKSLESHYREDLFQSVGADPEPHDIKPLEADKYIAMSMMQKAIRRGEFEFAFSAALTLLGNDGRIMPRYFVSNYSSSTVQC